MDLQLKGKRALVSGSHRGTGRAIAHAMAREGADVIVHGFELAAAEEAAAEIRAFGFSAVAVAGDICTDAGAADVIAACGDMLDDGLLLAAESGVAEDVLEDAVRG